MLFFLFSCSSHPAYFSFRYQYAATLIQKTYRANRARRAKRALELFQGNKERLAAVRLQAIFRAKLERARLRIKRKRMELQKLEEKASMVRNSKMSDSERIRMYNLQAELTEDASKFMNESLLRPNTTFSVVWKTVFCLSVVLELSSLIILINRPDLTKEALLPVPYSEREECLADRGPRFGKIMGIFGRNRVPETLPRYCEDDIVALQGLWVAAARIIVEVVLFIVNFMFFFDVPVSFFTGRFNPDTGVLEPNPFFTRWIAPGVLLQMIVNPKMDKIAEGVAGTVSRVRRLGPIRVFRWTGKFRCSCF